MVRTVRPVNAGGGCTGGVPNCCGCARKRSPLRGEFRCELGYRWCDRNYFPTRPNPIRPPDPGATGKENRAAGLLFPTGAAHCRVRSRHRRSWRNGQRPPARQSARRPRALVERSEGVDEVVAGGAAQDGVIGAQDEPVAARAAVEPVALSADVSVTSSAGVVRSELAATAPADAAGRGGPGVADLPQGRVVVLQVGRPLFCVGIQVAADEDVVARVAVEPVQACPRRR